MRSKNKKISEAVALTIDDLHVGESVGLPKVVSTKCNEKNISTDQKSEVTETLDLQSVHTRALKIF